MQIQEYTGGEDLKIAKLIEKIFYELGFSFDKDTTHKDLFDIKNYFTKFFIIRIDKEIVGTIGVKMDEDKISAGIKRLYLREDHRKKGWGRALLEKAIEFSKEMKAERVWLRTTERNVQALKIYKKNGLREYKREGDYIYLEKYLTN
jgi:ribosomal protein S18 acetylase RimI-like enzyme